MQVLAEIAVPMPMSLLAISTSTVSNWATGAGGFGLLLVVAADEQRGGTAGGEGDAKHNDTRGFHNASLTLLRDMTAGTRTVLCSPSEAPRRWSRTLPDFTS